MSAKKSYNRFFIIFQEEDKGYGISPDRPPTGYAKIETRNEKSKVTVYVQNLKPFESGECLYKCYLISHQDDKDSTVYLGILNIDDLGRSESAWESGAENAFDSKIAIDKFNGAAIVAEQQSASSVIAPLAGYMSKEKFEWRSKIVSSKKVQEVKEEVKVQVEVEAEVQNKFKEYEESIEKILNVDETTKQEQVPAEVAEVKQGTKFAEIENVKEEPAPVEAVYMKEELPVVEAVYMKEEFPVVESVVLEEAGENVEVEGGQEIVEEVMRVPEEFEAPTQEIPADVTEEEMDDEVRDKHEKEYKKEHKEGMKYGCAQCGYMGAQQYDFRHIMRKMLEDILADYEKMGKHKDLKDCFIWKVDMDKCRKDGYKMTMYPCYDLIFYPMMHNPMYNYYSYIKKHGHYLFGIKYDKERRVLALMFGIPGKNQPMEQPFGGATGFTKWIPWGSTGDGYWTMIYDPMTGIVLNQK